MALSMAYITPKQEFTRSSGDLAALLVFFCPLVVPTESSFAFLFRRRPRLDENRRLVTYVELVAMDQAKKIQCFCGVHIRWNRFSNSH